MTTLMLVQETWVTTYPTWDSLVSLVTDLHEHGFEPHEWRMHPQAYGAMLDEMPQPRYASGIDPYGRHLAALGAPLVLDTNLEGSRARCLVDVKSVVWPPAPVTS